MWKNKKRPFDSSPETVRAAALRLLDRRAYSQEELRRKLRQKGAETEHIDGVIDDLLAVGYLDDAKLTEALIHSRKELSPKGRAYVRWELRQKGIDEAVIEEGLAAYYPPAEEEQVAGALLQKWVAQNSPPVAERRKYLAGLGRKLGSRGFGASLIYQLLSNLDLPDQEEEIPPLDNADDVY